MLKRKLHVINHYRYFQKDQKGMTILELLVVLGIIALLGALVAPRVLQYLSKAKTETAQIQINNLSTAIELYRLDTGNYPSQEAGLTTLITAPESAKGWNGPYIKKLNGLTDPWGRKYHYIFPGKHGDFDLYSLGQDNAEGGDGDSKDVKSW